MLTRHSSHNDRRGIVLLVVMAMLALFAVVALSFVYYAEAEATASRYASQAQTQAQADVDPELLLSYYLSQLIYDTDNIYSAMRGHSLARNMYGYHNFKNSAGNYDTDWNVTPFNGVGRLRYSVPFNSLEQGNPPVQAAKNNMFLVNYQNFSGAAFAPRNPEMDKNGSKYVGGNVHWTYPDLNNMFLAAVTADGDVLIPSFHRPWLGPLCVPQALDPAFSTDPWARYMCLRPHPTYNPDFSSPDWDGGGDVKNLEWGKGTIIGGSFGPNVGAHVNNDSIWMDLAFPVMTAPNGKRYKPLFAALIVDLDNKINLYAHGNLRSPNPYSNMGDMGWGPWEVNLSKVLNYGTPNAKEWKNLFQANPIARYGATGQPEGTVLSPLYNNKATAATPAQQPLVIPPYYSNIDFGVLSSAPINYPQGLRTYPTYPVTPPWDNGTAVAGHPAGYTPLVPGNNTNRAALVMSQIEALYRFQGTGAPAMTSDLLAQLPQNLGDPVNGSRRRWLSTLLSMDLDRPGLVPFNTANMTGTSPTSKYTLTTSPTATAYPQTLVTPFPSPLPSSTSGEFDTVTYRSNVYSKKTSSQLIQPVPPNPLRVLLNRDLIPYPDPNGVQNPVAIAKAVQDRQDMARELYNMLIQITGARDPNLVTTMLQTGPEYQAARWLAQLAVNIVDFIDEDDYMTPFLWNPAGAPKEWLFGTELAHLVLNEVHAQMDNDASDPNVWISPVNSRYVTTGTPQIYNYRVNFWIELHNPMIAPPPTPPLPPGVSGVASYYPRKLGRADLNEYRVVVTPAQAPSQYVNSNFDKYDPTNTALRFFKWHEPGPGVNNPDLSKPIQSVPSPPGTVLLGTPAPFPTPKFPPGLDTVYPVNPLSPYGTTPIKNEGFYVLGPLPPKFAGSGPNNGKRFVVDTSTNAVNRDPQFTVSTDSNGNPALFPELSLPFALPPSTNAAVDPQSIPYGIFLQRLANPGLPYQPDPTLSQVPTDPLYKPYNPYVTIDYYDNFVINSGIVYTKIYPGTTTGIASVTPPALNSWRTMGRTQPYLGNNWVPQAPTPASNPQPQNTFFRHNGKTATVPAPPGGTLRLPFYWPAHLDRRLVNPLELLNVSCYRPWEFTQKFGQPENTNYLSPWSPWYDPSSLLYRFLEMTQTSRFTPQLQGPAPPGGRVTGKININTIWDQEILDALVDNSTIFVPNSTIGQPGDKFFKTFMDSRSPNVFTRDQATGLLKAFNTVGPTDEVSRTEIGNIALHRPFKSLNVGVYSPGDPQYPSGLGIENTILRSGVFQQPDSNPALSTYNNGPLPFKKNELLSKIFNNVTLRSNVFAVWLTVGFFEVTDESVYPVKLGKEIGRSENRHVRHRMFAVIDRTNLLAPNMQTILPNGASKGNGLQPVRLGQTVFAIQPASGQVKVKPIPIVTGMSLAIYDNPNPLAPWATVPDEVVTVQGVNYPTVTAIFLKSHPANAKVMVYTPVPPTPYTPIPPTSPALNAVLGNPGPQEGSFDVRENSLVVPYFSIIQ